MAERRIGGARLAEVFVYRGLESIRRCIEQQFLARDIDPHLLPLMVNGTVALWVIQRGVLVAGLDLRQFLRLRRGKRTIRLDDPTIESTFRAFAGPAESSLDLRADFEAIVAWAEPLLEPAARPGERVRFRVRRGIGWKPESCVAGRTGVVCELAYGFSDLENGDAPLCDFTDPDPP